uniref:Pentatricopeptide repeat-containing protein n=1 Tax=Hordeum vulgare subsp. vulgare TaxID=112509 RepID=A0A8I6X2E2_HORVV
MDEEGAPRDGFTFESALRACSGARSAELGRAVHRDALTAGLAADVSVCDALVEMYAQCGDMEMACQVFDAMPERDAVSWNVLLGGLLGDGGLSSQATEAWRRMLGEGHKPDSVVLSAMLWHHPGDGKQGREVHAWVICHWLETELSVANALIGMYSRKNELGHALSVFESMPVRDPASWNAILSAHSQDFRVLMMFRRMVDSGARPDETTFMAVLSTCDNLGLVEGGMKLFSEMENKYRIQPTVQHCTSLVNMLGKAGMVREAYQLIFSENRS